MLRRISSRCTCGKEGHPDEAAAAATQRLEESTNCEACACRCARRSLSARRARAEPVFAGAATVVVLGGSGAAMVLTCALLMWMTSLKLVDVRSNGSTEEKRRVETARYIEAGASAAQSEGQSWWKCALV
ncbi:unnamed protein product, partial [Ectocarpus sp. 4 AP-2014]